MQDTRMTPKRPMDVDLKAGETYSWCPCSRESHARACCGTDGGDMSQISFSALVDNTVSICTCKQTHDKPYCDGSHKVDF